MRSPRIVVGLGNPGPEYDWTPHNLGFHALDVLAGDSIFEIATRLHPRAHPSAKDLCGPDAGLQGEVHDGSDDFAWVGLAALRALLVKPLTFMNRSGDVVAPLARWCALEPAELMVVYDDMDLDLGRLRLRPHGGTGGHRGMASIVSALGTDRFPRLRIGVGRPRTDAARHVLAKLAGDELRIAEASCTEAAAAVRDWLETGDVERCMTRFHSRWNQMAAEQAAPTQEDSK